MAPKHSTVNRGVIAMMIIAFISITNILYFGRYLWSNLTVDIQQTLYANNIQNEAKPVFKSVIAMRNDSPSSIPALVLLGPPKAGLI